jgi:hypothetical protein
MFEQTRQGRYVSIGIDANFTFNQPNAPSTWAT